MNISYETFLSHLLDWTQNRVPTEIRLKVKDAYLYAYRKSLGDDKVVLSSDDRSRLKMLFLSYMYSKPKVTGESK